MTYGRTCQRPGRGPAGGKRFSETGKGRVRRDQVPAGKRVQRASLAFARTAARGVAAANLVRVLKRGAALAVGLLALAACAANDGDGARELERQLLKTRWGVCATPGECREYRRSNADCAGNGFEKEGGRTFYRCHIESREVGGRGRVSETVCAALSAGDEERGYVPRPLAVCRR